MASGSSCALSRADPPLCPAGPVVPGLVLQRAFPARKEKGAQAAGVLSAIFPSRQLKRRFENKKPITQKKC